MMDWLSAFVTSQTTKATLAGLAGGGVAAVAKGTTKRQVIKHMLVGALMSGFAGIGVADLLRVPDVYQLVCFSLGLSSWGIALFISMIDWQKIFAKWLKK